MSWNITVQSGSCLIIHFCLIYVMVVDRDLVWSWVPDVIAVACLCRKKQPERMVCVNKAGSGGLPDPFSSPAKATLRKWGHTGEVSTDLLHLHSRIAGHCILGVLRTGRWRCSPGKVLALHVLKIKLIDNFFRLLRELGASSQFWGTGRKRMWKILI